jgi:hypothetical protein
MATPAHAAVAGMSAVDPQNGFPTWFSDGNVKLQLCYMAGAGCLSEPPDTTVPASYPDNFPEEAFWFNASATSGNLGLYEASLEGAHVNGPVVPGEQMGFGRLRFRVNNLVAGASYKITHPYGVNTFTAAAVTGGGGRINQTIDAGVCAPTDTTPCNWAGVGAAFLGTNAKTTTSTFLKQDGAAPGTLGDINTARTVTGAPSGTNAIIVEGPNAGGNGINTLTVNQFTVQGLIFNGADAAPSTPDLIAASDSGKSSTDNITNVATPTLTGTVPGMGAANEATVELLVDNASIPAVGGSTLNGAYALDLPALSSGTHTVKARTPNPAYQLNPDTGVPVDPAVPQYLTSGTLTFTVDTVAPTTTIVAPFPSNPSLDSTPTVNFSGEAGASYECQLLPSNPDWDNTCTTPSKTYDQQLNGTYTFNVRATDAAGNVGTAATRTWRIGNIVAPGAPTIGTAKAGNGTADVTWTAPTDNGGGAVTGYKIAAVNSAGTVVGTPQPAAATATSATITGLTNGTAYTFKVLATNSAGDGAYSGLSNAVTPLTTPGAPAIGTVSGGDAAATVRWTAPASNGGSAITGYSVRTWSGTTLVKTTPVGNVTSTSIPGLTNGTAYTFDVAATNAAGDGSFSARSAAVTPAATPVITAPGVPTIGAATAGNTTATVNWTAPASNGGAAITGYSVRAFSGTTLVKTTPVGAVTSTSITGLTNGTAYTFDVAATNSAGTGAFSARTGAVTPTTPPVTVTVPGAPTIGAPTAGNTTATVRWTAPANTGGAAITGYSVRTFSGTTLVKTTPVGNVTSTSITALTNGTAYTFDVAATNSAGTGAFSGRSTAVTPVAAPAPVTVPGAPTIGTPVRGNASATVKWTAPASTGGAAITGYSVRTFSGTTLVKTTPVGNVLTTSITGLTNGTAYTFDVAATNSAGTGTFSARSVAVTPAVVTRTVTVNPVADTMGKQLSPTTAFGTTAALISDTTDTVAGSEIRSYLRFTVPALATGERITAANLNLNVTNATANGPAIWRTGTFTESTMTYNTKPARTGTATAGNFGAMAVGRVGAPISGVTAAGDVNFELMPESADGMGFDSRENATVANRPQLILTISN